MPPLISGQSYGILSSSVTPGSVALTANQIYLAPFFVPLSTNFDQLNCRTAAGGGATVDMGLYGPFTGTFDGLPAIVRSGNVSIAFAGPLTFAINITLGVGWYLLAFCYNGTGAINTIQASSQIATLGQAGAASVAFTTVAFYSTASPNLPASLTGNPSFSNITWPNVRLRVA